MISTIAKAWPVCGSLSGQRRKKNKTFLSCIFVYRGWGMHTCHSTVVVSRGQFMGDDSFLPPDGSWRFAGYQSW